MREQAVLVLLHTHAQTHTLQMVFDRYRNQDDVMPFDKLPDFIREFYMTNQQQYRSLSLSLSLSLGFLCLFLVVSDPVLIPVTVSVPATAPVRVSLSGFVSISYGPIADALF